MGDGISRVEWGCVCLCLTCLGSFNLAQLIEALASHAFRFLPPAQSLVVLDRERTGRRVLLIPREVVAHLDHGFGRMPVGPSRYKGA